ncbi:MAG: sugar ABC transporter substrate-binding protein [Kosmotoga sp.]|jgi:multiple sugar transport system substrate-binding protein|nr:MAG: sugar ABC transporter substrate-binding protein [Kosmotoga sp.]
MKKLLISFLIILLVSVAVQAVTLEYWMWDPELKGRTEELISKFEEENPDINVNLTVMEPSDYWTKIRIMAMTGKLPDVFNMSSGYIEEWATNGFLKDLTEYVETDINPDEFFVNLFEAGSEIANTEEVYAVPFALVVTVLYYNKDMFDEAGLNYPDSTWDWFDFLNAAEKLTVDKDGDNKIDQWGFWLYGRYAHIESWIYRNGGRLIDRSTMNFDPDENAVEALNFLCRLVTEFNVAPTPKSMEGVRQQDVFPRGLAAMWIDGSWNIDNNRMIAAEDMNWGIAEVPVGPHGVADSAYGWPDFIAMSAKTENADAAWKFIKFAAGEGLTMDMYMAGKIPSYKPLAYSEDFYDETKLPEEMPLLLNIAGKTMRTSFTNSWSEWRGYGPAESMGLNAIIDEILNGDIAFEEGLKKADENINKILDRVYE